MKRSVLLATTFACAAGAPPAPLKVVHNSSTLRFSYQWPASAAAIARLDKLLRTDMRNALDEARANAADAREAARDQKRDFIRQYYSASWLSLGQSSRLLSIAETVEAFTGGAHPNHSVDAVVWDRRLDRKISVGELFVHARDFTALTRAIYCRKLDAERLKRRGERFGGQFDECPKSSDLAIAPEDSDRNGRFDRIQFVAAPYIAGPYSDGTYTISLPVSSAMIAALEPEYRSSFEVQRQ